MTRPLEIPSRRRRVLVAGGAGFLGSHLCDHLVARGHEVVALDNFLTGSPANCAHLQGHPRFRLVRHDVCDPLPADLAADVVFNLACAASPPRYQADPVHTMMTSVLGTRHLLDLAARHDAVFVQASTSEVYGDPDQHPQREAYWGNVNPTGPRACYDEGKRAGETLCFDYLRLGLADVRVARIFNTYGPRMQPDDGRIVSNFVVQALTGRPLTVYGTGEQTRSFCYVSDLVAGLVALAALDRTPDGPVNLGNPGEFTVIELARMVLERTGAASGIAYRPLPEDDPRRRRPDIALARRLLGWTPRVLLAEGLGPTIDWFARTLETRPAAARRPRRPLESGASL
ncbi:UDP-glucuronic acid decarboxylase family protein [Prosthecomicrobium sp. N25]|uniref:UDP-glucuronic acid decarboxylase family protein n=1 Tax=Prosthecomicrobium sp. N25 TaxID=3129254 RepID=UPI003076F00D